MVQVDFKTVKEMQEIEIRVVRMYYGHGHPGDKCVFPD
jgi:hypothetical protein